MVLLFSALVALCKNVLQMQIDLHFTKVQEILFKNFCSLAPVAIAVRSVASYRYSMRSSIDLWCIRRTLYFINVCYFFRAGKDFFYD